MDQVQSLIWFFRYLNYSAYLERGNSFHGFYLTNMPTRKWNTKRWVLPPSFVPIPLFSYQFSCRLPAGRSRCGRTGSRLPARSRCCRTGSRHFCRGKQIHRKRTPPLMISKSIVLSICKNKLIQDSVGNVKIRWAGSIHQHDKFHDCGGVCLRGVWPD